MRIEQYKLLFLSSLGGLLEFYDFIIYALFAGYISKNFFPSSDPITNLIVTFATFSIGYLVRPLGGFIFGHFGDRIGRKTTFTISILMMALATLGIAITPSYSTIGMAAPILIIIFRIIQGLSIGGEIPGALTYVSESIPNHKGLGCGIVFSALLFGIVLGSIVQACVATIFTATQMQSYGFRIPFLMGAILGLLSYLLRKDLQESAQFLHCKNDIEKFPIVTVFTQTFFQVIAGTFLTALCASTITGLFLFIPVYFTEILHLPANAYVIERIVVITLGSLLTVFFAYLTDKFSLKKLIQGLAFSAILLSYPIFTIYVYYPQFYFLAFLLSAFLIGFAAGVVPRLLTELFPTKIRYSGIASSYNLGFAVFGGLTPLISLTLIYYTTVLTMPALYLMTIALLALPLLVAVTK